MSKTVKCLLLKVDNVIVTEIVEVGSELGEPDCKLVKPHIVTEYKEGTSTLTPFLYKVTKQDTFMMSSDKILTLADPTPTLLEKYEDLIKE